MLFAVALMASAITLPIAGFFDPFGKEGDRADLSARRATGINLCINVASFNARLAGITAIETTGEELTPSDANLKVVLVDGLKRMSSAQRDLGIVCPGPLNSQGPNEGGP